MKKTKIITLILLILVTFFRPTELIALTNLGENATCSLSSDFCFYDYGNASNGETGNFEIITKQSYLNNQTAEIELTFKLTALQGTLNYTINDLIAFDSPNLGIPEKWKFKEKGTSWPLSPEDDINALLNNDEVIIIAQYIPDEKNFLATFDLNGLSDFIPFNVNPSFPSSVPSAGDFARLDITTSFFQVNSEDQQSQINTKDAISGSITFSKDPLRNNLILDVDEDYNFARSNTFETMPSIGPEIYLFTPTIDGESRIYYQFYEDKNYDIYIYIEPEITLPQRFDLKSPSGENGEWKFVKLTNGPNLNDIGLEFTQDLIPLYIDRTHIGHKYRFNFDDLYGGVLEIRDMSVLESY